MAAGGGAGVGGEAEAVEDGAKGHDRHAEDGDVEVAELGKAAGWPRAWATRRRVTAPTATPMPRESCMTAERKPLARVIARAGSPCRRGWSCR